MIQAQQIPLSLYIHFPWCIKKCPYCDFNSHAKQPHFSEERYIQALFRDIDAELTGPFKQVISNRSLISIFMGGGTPSLFSSDAIKRLVDFVSKKLKFYNQIEITLEANPGSSEYDSFAGYFDAGVNRLSLGIQSFDDMQLENLGRVHDSQTACRAIKNAQAAGFKNINLDIIYGLKNQTLEDVQQECRRAMDHNPQHLSFYQLTIEPNTLFFHHPPKLPEESLITDMQDTIQQHVHQQQLQQYEVSAYSKQGRQCEHNINYWQYGDYLGIGAGAHSKITNQQGIHRFWKQKHPSSYMQKIEQGISVNHSHQVLDQEINFEFLMNSLRLKQGFEIIQYEKNTGKKSSNLLPALQHLREKQLLEVSSTRVRCTPRGYQLLDEILPPFLP